MRLRTNSITILFPILLCIIMVAVLLIPKTRTIKVPCGITAYVYEEDVNKSFLQLTAIDGAQVTVAIDARYDGAIRNCTFIAKVAFNSNADVQCKSAKITFGGSTEFIVDAKNSNRLEDFVEEQFFRIIKSKPIREDD